MDDIGARLLLLSVITDNYTYILMHKKTKKQTKKNLEQVIKEVVNKKKLT